MTIPTLLLSLATLQDPMPGPAPQAPQPAVHAGARLDLVELKNGEVLEGRIVLERGNYLEIELGPGAQVGFRTTEVASVRRGAGGPVRAAPAGALAPRDEWFVLYDGAGRAVGWLHGTVTRGEDGGSRLLEEWEFSEGRRHFQVTVLETTDREQRPQSCYFRERISEELLGAPGDPLARRNRVQKERIVEASVDGEVLHVRRLAASGRTERSLPWPADGTFPLLARRHGCEGAAGGASEVTVFDPAAEELQRRTFGALQQRTVRIDGAEHRIGELVEQGLGTRNAVWIDAAARVLRREIAGPGLVAVPSDAETAREAVGDRAVRPSLFVAEPQRRFGLWRPNPAWDALPPDDGTVRLQCALHGAGVTLVLLDHLDPGATLDAAAAAVERWFRLLEPGQRIEERSWTRVRGRDAVRLLGRGGTGLQAARTVLHVLPWQEQFVVLRCNAPEAVWDELSADFAAIAARLELDPEGLPALLPEDRGPEPVAGEPSPVPPEQAAAKPPRARPAPRVRIPREQDPGR